MSYTVKTPFPFPPHCSSIPPKRLFLPPDHALIGVNSRSGFTILREERYFNRCTFDQINARRDGEHFAILREERKISNMHARASKAHTHKIN